MKEAKSSINLLSLPDSTERTLSSISAPDDVPSGVIRRKMIEDYSNFMKKRLRKAAKRKLNLIKSSKEIYLQ